MKKKELEKLKNIYKKKGKLTLVQPPEKIEKLN